MHYQYSDLREIGIPYCRPYLNTLIKTGQIPAGCPAFEWQAPLGASRCRSMDCRPRPKHRTIRNQKMTQLLNTTTDPASLSPAARTSLLNDWREKNRTRKAEQQRIQQRIYLRTVDGDNANALKQALARHNGSDENSINDAAALAIITKDIDFWAQAVGQLSHLVRRDEEIAAVAASLAARPIYMARLRDLADACESVWKAFLAVDAVGTDLRAKGYAPSMTILPGAPLSYLAAFNPDNPESQISAFKRMLAAH
jgi:hypothetical protein